MCLVFLRDGWHDSEMNIQNGKNDNILEYTTRGVTFSGNQCMVV